MNPSSKILKGFNSINYFSYLIQSNKEDIKSNLFKSLEEFCLIILLSVLNHAYLDL